MKNIEQIKKLSTTAAKLRSLWDRYTAAISAPSCGKHGFGFNRDSGFSVTGAMQASLDAYTGQHGSSSCYTFDNIPLELAQELFTKALNKHTHLLLDTMAEIAELEASKLVSSAKAELAELEKSIEAATKPESEPAT